MAVSGNSADPRGHRTRRISQAIQSSTRIAVTITSVPAPIHCTQFIGYHSLAGGPTPRPNSLRYHHVP